MKTKTISILLFLLFTFSLAAQKEGKEVSHYLFPEFTRGTIKFKTGQVQFISLNYNSVTEEMIFNSNGNNLAIADPMSIDTITILGRQFIPYQKIFYEVVEVLPVPLLIHHTANVIPPGKQAGYGSTSETSSITERSSFISSGKVYDMKLPDDYRVSPETEYVIKKDKFYKISNVNQVVKYFPEKKEAIREFVKKNKTNFKKTEDMKQMIEFCNK
jgi:hypothetical protein